MISNYIKIGHRIRLKQCMAGFLVFSFTLSNIFPQMNDGLASTTTLGAETMPLDGQAREPESLGDLIKDLAVPTSLGEIKKKYHGRADGPGIIILQDAHAIPGAQKSLEGLTAFFHANHQIKIVGLEGASGRLDTLFFRAFPDGLILREFFSEYVDRGELSGAAVAAAMNEQAPVFYGVENPVLYEKCIDEFLKSLEVREVEMTGLRELGKRLGTLKEVYYPELLMKLDRELVRFENSAGDLLETLKALDEAGTASGFVADSLRFPKLEAVLRHARRMGQPHGERMDLEIKQAAARLQKTLISHQEKQEFYAKQQSYRTEQIRPEAFAAYLKDLADRKEQPLDFSGALGKLLAEYRELKKLTGEDFFRDLKIHVRELKEFLFRSPAEKKIDDGSRRLLLLEKLVKLELTFDEWFELKETSRTLEEADRLTGMPLPGDLAGFLREVNRALDRLTRERSSFFRFYQLAEERDAAFLENFFERMKEHRASKGLLVAGGFHSQGLVTALEARGISYAVLTPNIETIPEKTGYLDYMQGQVSWKNYFRTNNGRIRVDEAFREAAAERLMLAAEKRMPPEAVKPFLRKWREEILKKLALENRLAEAAAYTRVLDRRLLREINEREKERLEKEWMKSVDRFVDSLRNLQREDRLSAENVIQLMKQPTAVPWTSVMPFAASEVPASWVHRRAPESAPEPVIQPALKAAAAEEEPPSKTAGSGPEFPGWSGWLAISPAYGGSLLVAQLTHGFSLRSELRLNKESVAGALVEMFDRLNDHSVVSFQMESGLPPHIFDWLMERFGDHPTTRAAQSTVTGGLGALMPDLFEAWKARKPAKPPMDVTGIHMIWEEVKSETKFRPQPGENLGTFLRTVFSEHGADTGITLDVDLNITDDFRSWARSWGRARGSKAQGVFGKRVKARVFKIESTYNKAPQYYLDLYFLKDESLPDTDENDSNRVRFCNEVYDDDLPMRNINIAAYRDASEALILELQKQKILKEKLVLIDNEVFVSLPRKRLPNAKKVHINHTVYRPGMYEPDQAAYELLGFQEWMRGHIVHYGKISIADYVALDYDLITGVGNIEHMPKLKEDIFPTEGQLRGYEHDGVRSTNGVFIPRWRANERTLLVEQMKEKIGMSDNEDQEFAEALPSHPELFDQFKRRNEYIAAMSVAQFLVWLRHKQKKTGKADWLKNTFAKYNHPDLDDEATVNAFVKAVQNAVENDNDQIWEQLNTQSETLKDILLSDPMVSNVRRQVPYKGPDKWREMIDFLEYPQDKEPEKWMNFLNFLEKDKPALEYFKEHAGRSVIGGRTFDAEYDERGRPVGGALGLFQWLKDMIVKLGLEDRITTVEDYNIWEAPIIFQAMSGTVMLSDEFLEASATSMMKGAVNFAEIIGVFGGADPEIWLIREKATGREINIFNENGKPVTHDQLKQKIESGEWEITNGRPIWYLPYGWGRGREQSTQQGGWRRPSAESLLMAILDLTRDHRNPEKRRERQFGVFAGSHKVDMTLSQALAHMRLIEGMIRAKDEEEDIFSALDFSAEDMEKILSINEPKFYWKTSDRKTVREDQTWPGLMGFIDTYRYFRFSGSQADRGKEALASVRYHTTHKKGQGDIFDYLVSTLGKLSGGMKGLKDKINALAKEAAKTKDETRKIGLVFQALQIMDDFVVLATGKLFEAYLTEEDPVNLNRMEEILSRKPVRRNVVRYLDHHPRATFLKTGEKNILAYRFDQGSEPKIIALDMGAVAYADPAEGGALKAKTRLVSSAALDDLLDTLSQGDGEHLVFQPYDLKAKRYFQLFNLADMREKFELSIPVRSGIQVVGLIPRTARVINYLSAAIQEKSLGDSVPLVSLIEEVKQMLQGPDSGRTLQEAFLNLGALGREGAKGVFTKGGYSAIPAVMGIIAMLAPRIFYDPDEGFTDMNTKIRSWDPEAYDAIKEKVMETSPELFSGGKIFVHTSSRHATSLVLSRVAGDRHIVMVAQLVPYPVGARDGKVWNIITDLNLPDTEGRISGLQVDPNKTYQARDPVLHRAHEAFLQKHSGQSLLDRWQVGVSVERRDLSGSYPLGVQFIELVEEKELERRKPAEIVPEAQRQVPGLRLAANLKDAGATVTPESEIVYEGSLDRLMELLPVLRGQGVEEIYFYGGLYEMAEATGTPIHSGRPGSDREEFYQTADGKGVIRVADYPTKVTTYQVRLRDGVATIRHHDGPNPFSIFDIRRLNPGLSRTRLKSGTAEETVRKVKALLREAKRLGIRVTLDYFPWVSPEAIDETNYGLTFYKEISDDENERFRRMNPREQEQFLKDLITPARHPENKGYWARRITEAGRPERVILIRHLISEYGGENVDQVILNPFLPEVQKYMKDSLAFLKDLGADDVRVDLAHYYLRDYILDPARGYFTDEYWASLPAERRSMAEKAVREIQEPWQPVLEAVTDITLTVETYHPDHRAKLVALGKGRIRSYYQGFFEALWHVLKEGGSVEALKNAITYAKDHRSEIYIYPRAFDNLPFKLMVQENTRAVHVLLAALHYLGFSVMWDLSDWTMTGHVFPIPGGGDNINRRDAHPFADQSDFETLTDRKAFLEAVRNSQAARIIRDFFDSIAFERETFIELDEHSGMDRYLTIAWETETADWMMLVVDLKPWQDGDTLSWIQLPYRARDQQLGPKGYDAVDALDSLPVEIDETKFRFTNLKVGKNRQFRLIHLKRRPVQPKSVSGTPALGRSELRQVPLNSSPELFGKGAKAKEMARKLPRKVIDSATLDRVLAVIDDRIRKLGEDQASAPLEAVLSHLQKLKDEEKIYGFDELRWTNGSYRFAETQTPDLGLGMGLFADAGDQGIFAAEMVFAAALQRPDTQTVLKRAGFSGDLIDANFLAQKLFGERSIFEQKYKAFHGLTDKVFLDSAVRRFDGFNEGETYFETYRLFKDWFDHTVTLDDQGKSGAEVYDLPVLEQAGFLARRLIDNRLRLRTLSDRLPGLRKDVMAMDSGSDEYRTTIQLINADEDELHNAMKVLYPLSGFAFGRMMIFSFFGKMHEIIDHHMMQLRQQSGSLSASEVGTLVGGLDLTEDVLQDVMLKTLMKKQQYWLAQGHETMLAISEPASREAFEKSLKWLQDLAHVFLSEHSFAWQKEMIERFYLPTDQRMDKWKIPFPGLDGSIGWLELEGLASIFYARNYPEDRTRPDSRDRAGDLISHYGKLPGFKQDWPRLTRVAEQWDDGDNLEIFITDGSPLHSIVSDYRKPYYHWDEEFNRLRIQINTALVWADIIDLIRFDPDSDVPYAHGMTERVEFLKVLSAMMITRKNLEILGRKKIRESFFAPDGIDLTSWAQTIVRGVRSSQSEFWVFVLEHFGTYENYFTQTRADRVLVADFWIYYVLTHPENQLAELSGALTLDGETGKLTAESAKALMDAVFALYWSGPPRDEKTDGNLFWISRLFSFLHFHPDGISVPDLDELKRFLAQYRKTSEEQDSGLEAFERWRDQFGRDYPDHSDRRFDSVDKFLPSNFELLVPDRLSPDSPNASMRLVDSSFYQPELFPADDLLKPERHPWKGVSGDRKEALWTVTYRSEGIQVPGSSMKYKFTGIEAGTRLLVVVRAGQVQIRAAGKDDWLLELSLKDFLATDGESSDAWQRIPSAGQIDILAVSDGINLQPGLFYSVRLEAGGLLRFPFEGAITSVSVPASFSGDVLLAVQNDGITLYRIHSSGNYSYAAKLRKTSHGLESLTKDFSVFEPLHSLVAHEAPETAIRYLELNQLATRLQGLAASGRGYRRIVLIDGLQAPEIRLQSGEILINSSLLGNSENTARLLEEALGKEDPVYLLEMRVTELREFKDLYRFDIPIPEKLQPVEENGMTNWTDSGKREYQRLWLEMQRLHQKYTVLRKIDAERVKRAQQGDWGSMKSAERLRPLLEGLLDQALKEDLPFRFWMKNGQTKFGELGTLKKSEGDNKVFEGAGTATPAHFQFSVNPRTQQGQFSLGMTDSSDRAQYLFVRYVKDGQAVITLFDLKTGEILDSDEHAYRKLQSRLALQKESLFADAIWQRSEFDVGRLEEEIDLFLDRFQGATPFESLESQIKVLATLSGMLHRVLDSSEYPEEINFAVLRLLFEDILSDGMPKADERAEALFKGLKIEPKKLLFFFYETLKEKAGELGLSRDEDEQIIFDDTFDEFLELVVLPWTVAPPAGTPALAEEDFSGAVIQHAINLKAIIENLLAAFPDAASSDGEQWSRDKIAVIKQFGIEPSATLETGPAQKYFIRAFYRQETEKTAAQLAAQEEALQRQQVSAEEMARRSSEIFFFGGRNIGASALGLKHDGTLIVMDAGSMINRSGRPRSPAWPDFDQIPEEDQPQLVLLPHNHMDHVGDVVSLFQRLKGKTPVYVPEGMTEHLKLLLLNHLRDSIRSYEQKRQEWAAIGREHMAPLREDWVPFEEKDIESLMANVRELAFDKWYAVSDTMKIRLHPAGHLHAAAAIAVMTDEQEIVYTSDYSKFRQGPVPGWKPWPKDEPVHEIVSEATRPLIQDDEAEQEARLIKEVVAALARGGKVLIPAFAQGRAQRVLHLLLEHSSKFPASVRSKLKIYIDGQAQEFTRLYQKAYPSLRDERVELVADSPNPWVKREAILRTEEPAIIIASSGTATDGSMSAYYAEGLLESPEGTAKNLILFVGHQFDEDEVGSRLLNAKPGTYFSFGPDRRAKKLDAEVMRIGLSGHVSGHENLEVIESMNIEGSLHWVTFTHGRDANRRALIREINQRALGGDYRYGRGAGEYQTMNPRRSTVTLSGEEREKHRRRFEAIQAEKLQTRRDVASGEKTSSPARSELRDVIQPVISSLASRIPISRPAAGIFVFEIQSRGIETVIPMLRDEAREPFYLEWFSDTSRGRFSELQETLERIRAGHPEYDDLRDKFMRTGIRESLLARAREFLDTTQGGLNYAMAFRFYDSPQLIKWASEYLATIQEIRDLDRSRVRGNIRILMTPEEVASDRADIRRFRDLVARSRVAEIVTINPSTPEVNAFVLQRFVEKNGNALIYGMPDLPLPAKHQNRLVRSDVGEEDTFLVAALLSRDLAEVKGKVDEGLLSRVSLRVPGLRFNGRNIEITTVVLELVLRYQAMEHIATMA